MLSDHLAHFSVSMVMTKTSLFMEGPPPKSDSARLRVQVLGVGRWVWAAKAKGVSVDARRTADTRRVDLSMGSPAKAMRILGLGRRTLHYMACGKSKEGNSVAAPFGLRDGLRQSGRRETK